MEYEQRTEYGARGKEDYVAGAKNGLFDKIGRFGTGVAVAGLLAIVTAFSGGCTSNNVNDRIRNSSIEDLAKTYPSPTYKIIKGDNKYPRYWNVVENDRGEIIAVLLTPRGLEECKQAMRDKANIWKKVKGEYKVITLPASPRVGGSLTFKAHVTRGAGIIICDLSQEEYKELEEWTKEMGLEELEKENALKD